MPLVVFDNEDVAQIGVRASRLRLHDHSLAIDLRADRRRELLRSVDSFFGPLVESGAACRPVISIDDDPLALREVGAWASQADSTIVLRLRVLSLGARERLQQAMVLASAATRTARDRIHIVLDQADDPTTGSIGTLVRLLAENGPWASITVAAGSAPAMASLGRRGEWVRFERRELAIARTLDELGDLGTPLGLGDYANRHPLLEAGLTHARGNGLRWPTDDAWQFMRETVAGGVGPAGDARRDALLRLADSGAFQPDRPRSWGERAMAKFLRGEAEPDQLNAWMINHHIEITSQRLASPAPAATTAVPVS